MVGPSTYQLFFLLALHGLGLCANARILPEPPEITPAPILARQANQASNFVGYTYFNGRCESGDVMSRLDDLISKTDGTNRILPQGFHSHAEPAPRSSSPAHSQHAPRLTRPALGSQPPVLTALSWLFLPTLHIQLVIFSEPFSLSFRFVRHVLGGASV